MNYKLYGSTPWFYPRLFEKREVLLEVFEAVAKDIKCQ